MRAHGIDPDAINHEVAQLLPDPGPSRWWKVERNTKYKSTPITVTLMESQVGKKRALSSPLAFEVTIAEPRKVAEAAELVLARVGDYPKVVGSYGGE